MWSLDFRARSSAGALAADLPSGRMPDALNPVLKGIHVGAGGRLNFGFTQDELRDLAEFLLSV